MPAKFKRPTLTLDELKKIFESPLDNSEKIKKRARDVLWYLNGGKTRVVENDVVNVWVKNAILTFFKTAPVKSMSSGVFEYFDKLTPKPRSTMKGVRVVPGAVVRFGSFIEEGAIVMPSFINIGAYVGAGSMIDTWATVGSCAQIGRNVHLSGGVGIGGVLEPAQATPVIIEDGAFIGSRSIIVEGVRVKKEAVIGAGVTLTASTKIVDVRGKTPVYLTGEIPERAVVIPGSLPKDFPAGQFEVGCALIIGERKASTDLKTSLNEALRSNSISV